MPFQIFASGWMGMTAGWLGLAKGRLRRRPRIELSVLAAFGIVWGFLFGAVMNLWFWPLMASGESISWRAGMGFEETIRHYWSFYILTSAGWDVWRSLANLVLILALGRPVLDLLIRFRQRFQVELG
jgi:energy-coupling factor transport system substrate-specific component